MGLRIWVGAVGKRIADNKGVFAGTVVGTQVCPNLTTTGTGALTANTFYDIYNGGTVPSTGIDLSCLTPTYIPSALPSDPTLASGADTGYDLSVDAVGRVTIRATGGAEPSIPNSTTISLTR